MMLLLVDDTIDVVDVVADVDVDAVHVYIHGHDPKGKGSPSSTRAPDGIK